MVFLVPQLTQSTIQSQMQELINSEEWGDPRSYSVTINRKGEALETEYSVVPSPAKPTPADIIEAYNAKAINLDALFSGGNPFETPVASAPVDTDAGEVQGF